MKVIKWLLINGLFATLIYFGVIQQHEGVGNIILFWTWFLGAISLLFTHKDVIEKNKAWKPTVPVWLDVSFDIAVVTVFIYNSWWFTGLMYLIHIIVLSAFREKVKELQGKGDGN